MNNENYAVIDLTIDSKDFKEENIIHKNEFEQAKKLIQEQVPGNLQDITKNGDFEGYYKTILVEGGRGTGKTTFLKNFFNKNITETSLNDIEILPFLDPTRIENKTSIFLTIVSLIRECIYNKFGEKINECGIECKRKSWDDILNKLAKGLPSIDDNHKEPYYWDDDFMIMEKGLSATKSAFDLRKNFKILIKESLELLGKKAFLLIVDDVDTDCNKAWRLLETLRKYLCIQGFVTVVSGNLELFSLEVQQEQARVFQDLSSNNKEKQISELTDQYLRKVFPPRYRISLENLSYVMEKSIYNFNKPVIKILYDSSCDKEFPTPLIDFIRDTFYALGICNKYQLSAYSDFVLSLPLRSQIDFYRVFKNFLISEKMQQQNGTRPIPLEIDEITGLFTEDLFKFHIDADLLKMRPFVTNCVILKFLTEAENGHKKLTDYYQLQPVTLDSSLNSALFTLGIVLSERIYRYPELLFNYVIKVGLIRNTASILNNAPTDKGNHNFSLQNMIRYSAMDDDIDLRHSTCVLIAYLRSIAEKISGVFEISEISKKKLFPDNIKTQKSITSIIAQLPYSCSRDSSSGEDHYEYSIYTLIATVYDVIRAIESGDELNSILLKNAQPREYLMVQENDIIYDTDSKINENVEENAIEDKNFLSGIALQEHNSIKDIGLFETELKNWMDFSKRIGKYSQPYILAKICTRMYYAYSNISLKKGKTNRSVYEVMQDYILLMFNSVLIEESTEYLSELSINRNNEVDTFYLNLEEVINKNKINKLPLSKIILTCPFFLYFVDFDGENKNRTIIDFYQKAFDDENKGLDYKSKPSCLPKNIKIKVPRNKKTIKTRSSSVKKTRSTKKVSTENQTNPK